MELRAEQVRGKARTSKNRGKLPPEADQPSAEAAAEWMADPEHLGGAQAKPSEGRRVPPPLPTFRRKVDPE